ncbi:hypothetical protein TRFO_11171 [Tritrichomonas foetus]|uniref:Uncharacterized protein n=1 Tax=Tritrichomonas foetus TaxID=1144522 RepID=A0A1J4J4Q3_9EUKA|nr:hypothetical protein TRFO_11171 [Tritrichomonas foetus]|eukprot:OHS94318.1 hypothetical protein TRFO_11171 [Tritrichomonas foetus]
MHDNQTCTMVRNLIIDAIKDNGRPITAHEYEQWLEINKTQLWSEVVKKCHDYTRVIVTSGGNSQIAKYYCSQTLPSIDRRSVFFGIKNHEYDNKLWIKITERKRKQIKNPHLPKKSCNDDSSFSYSHTSDYLSIDSENTNLSDNTSPIAIENAIQKGNFIIPTIPSIVSVQNSTDNWQSLSEKVSFTEHFWSDLITALSDVHEYVFKGFSLQDILNMVINQYESLQNSNVTLEVINILTNHFIQMKQITPKSNYSTS